MLHTETLRGLACFFLVLFHVVGDTPAAGLRLDADHELQWFNQALTYLRMPLFAGIAGYVYAHRPSGTAWQGFLAGKARRLLLPLLTVGSVFALLQSVTPGANGAPAAPWQVLVLPTAHYWFLQALFLVFLATAALERFGLLARPGRTLAVGLVAAAVFLSVQPPPWFSLDGALYLMPFFLVGVAVRQVGAVPRAVLALIGFAFVALVLAVLTSAEPIRPRQSLASLALGALGVWLLIALPWHQRVLMLLGRYSYAVFLFHVFFTAAARIAMVRLGVDSVAVLVTTGMLAGIAGPVVVARIVQGSRWASLLLLGARVPDGASVRRGAATSADSARFLQRPDA